MKRDFATLDKDEFDLLVIGGGVYGAWTAYDAALRGLKVALLDQGDWAGGTSSASSKLIHGGLRYLETLDFKLVKKALDERQRLFRLAPHRVWPLRFGVPLYPKGRLGRLTLKAGLILYDFLADTRGTSRAHRYYGRNAFAERFPRLNPRGLTGGYTYLDAQTDDARFVLELVDGALSRGAVCVNYCQVRHLISEGGKACGADIEDAGTDRTIFLRAKRIVDATGRWMGRFAPSAAFRLTKGVHLVMPPLLDSEALLLTARSDGRVFFMMPWYGATLLGTTDTDFHGDLDRVAVEPDDVAYLLREANGVLQGEGWGEQHILGRFAGIRVLRESRRASPSSVSRDWEFHTGPDGVIHSLGGKFTSAREDCAQLVDHVCATLGVDAPGRTGSVPFPWRPEGDFETWHNEAVTEATALGVDGESTTWLLRRHGRRVFEVFSMIRRSPDLGRRIIDSVPLIRADLHYCAGHEMVTHLEDLLRRRLPLLILAPSAREHLRSLALEAAPILGWNGTTVEHEVQRCGKPWQAL